MTVTPLSSAQLQMVPPETKPPGVAPGIAPIETGLKGVGTLSSNGEPLAPFAQVLENMAKSTRDALVKSEAIAKAAAAGKADPQLVATTTVETRATLQQFTALLHATTSAYQEVMRMAL